MKKLFKWSINTLLGLVLVAIVTTLFLLNSAQTIVWIADRYAPQYDFGYSKISGGLLSGLEVRDLAFKGDKLADNLKIRWNITSLLYGRVTISHVDAVALNVENIQKVVASFTSDKPKKKDDNSSFVMPVSIGISKLHLTLYPLQQSGIAIESLDLDGRDIVYSGERVDIANFLLTTDTNITSLHLEGALQERVVKIKELSLLEIDSVALVDITQTLDQESNATQKRSSSQERGDAEKLTDKKKENSLIPIRVDIERLKLVLKPAIYPKFKIDKAQLNSSNIGVDIERILQSKSDAIEVGSLSIFVDSNLSRLSLDSSLNKERVTIHSLSIQEIDTLALTKIFAPDENSTIPDTSTPTAETNESKPTNPLIPKELFIATLNCSIKSTSYDPIEIESLELNGSKILFDTPKLLAKEGSIEINASTSFATLIQEATISNDQLKSKGSLTLLKKLYEAYEIPLRADALESIPIEIDANKKHLKMTVAVDGKELLQAKEGAFNIEALHLLNTINYTIANSKLRVESDGNISTPYAKDIRLYNLLRYEDKNLEYRGKIIPGKLEGVDSNYTKPLQNLKISYDGDISSITAYIDSDALVGKFYSPDFKKAELNLTTKSPLILNELITLPLPLQKAIASINIDLPLDFTQIMPLQATIKIDSNIANIDAALLYDKELQISSTTTLPSDTLLKGFGEELNIKAIETIQTNLKLAEQNLTVALTSQGINSDIKLDMKSKDILGNLKVGTALFDFDGNLDGNITLNNQMASLQEFLKKINTIYRFEAPPIDGDLELSLVVKKLKDVSLQLHSKKLLYKADRTTSYELNATSVSLRFDDDNLTLESYATTFQKQKIFATKPSKITLKKSNIIISPLWINDQLKVTGSYDMKKKRGDIIAYADPLSISQAMIDLQSKVDIEAKLDGNETTIKGKVTLLGGDLHINMDKKSFAADSDIIIVQDQKKKQSSPFMENLSVMVKIDSQKPLLYKEGDANIKITTDLLVQKEKYDIPRIFGTAHIEKGSYYIIKNKKFIFKKSLIAFTGNMENPILDISVVYNSINYEITIQVTGSPQTPSIIFSSTPNLTREQILSVILFDAKDAGDGSSGDDMMKMMGGAMAKSALANIGIKLDHLSIGTDGSVEIGKQISKKVTIIYVDGEVATTKLQYDYSRDIKAVISTDAESSGVDIIYKRAF